MVHCRRNVIFHFDQLAYVGCMIKTATTLLFVFALPLQAQDVLSVLRASGPATDVPQQGAPLSQSDVLFAEMLPGWRLADGNHIAALHLQLAPRWKTYWRAPGDAGVPPEFDWSGSRNVKSVRVLWPRPRVFNFSGMQTIGYDEDVILPVEVTPIDPAQPVFLGAAVDLGVCRDICMPASLELDTALPAFGQPDQRIEQALAAQPLSAADAGVDWIDCDIEATDTGLRVTAALNMPGPDEAEVVVIEPGAMPVWVSETTVQRDGLRLTATAEMLPATGDAFHLDPQALRLTVLSGTHAVEITGCPQD